MEDLCHYENHIHQRSWPEGHMAGTFVQTIILAHIGRKSLHWGPDPQRFWEVFVVFFSENQIPKYL